MEIARSTFYDKSATQDDTAIVAAVPTICEEFGYYGWRRVRASFSIEALTVNHKKVRRLMREHDLQPRRRRRYVATSDSDHDQPIYPNRAKDLTIDGPDQLWVADITYVAILDGFAYVAGDPRRLVAPSGRICHQLRSIDVRLTHGRPEHRNRPAETRRQAAFITHGQRVAICRSRAIGRRCFGTASSSVRWGAEATLPTTIRRQRAS